MHICDQGCTFVARLIVTGPSRGRIFNLDIQSRERPYFASETNFADWYERWLDLAIAGDPKAWFWYGYDNPAYREIVS